MNNYVVCKYTKLMHAMNSLRPTRVVYDGSDPSDDWIITELGHSSVDIDRSKLKRVETLDEYVSGCKDHDEGCMGEMCVTPSGVILPPQSLAIYTPSIRNDIYQAARVAFQGSTDYYRTQSIGILSKSLKGKEGRMRKGILNCHIDGSLRMVISPDNSEVSSIFASLNSPGTEIVEGIGCTIYLPWYLKDNWSTVRLDETTNRYVVGYVREGDRAILVREPILTGESILCVRIAFWNRTNIGISPKLVKPIGGDYDGDEVQIYPVYSEEAVKECDDWITIQDRQFNEADTIFSTSGLLPVDNTALSYMNHTTISLRDIKEGPSTLLLAEQTRTRMTNIKDMQIRMDTRWCIENFIDESIRGLDDINNQQLSQPIVGDMSRIARIAASCVYQSDDGSIYVMTHDGPEFICNAELDTEAGLSGVRSESRICARSQQIRLDSHKASEGKLPTHDIVSDMVVDSDENSNTLIILRSTLGEDYIRKNASTKWVHRDGDLLYCLCDPKKSGSISRHEIVNSFNPIILASIAPERRMAVCKAAIEYVAKYVGVPISAPETNILASLYTYKPGATYRRWTPTGSIDICLPITTREGMRARRLCWIDVVMANHYKCLQEMLEDGNIPRVPIRTVSSALVSGNFRDLF